MEPFAGSGIGTTAHLLPGRVARKTRLTVHGLARLANFRALWLKLTAPFCPNRPEQLSSHERCCASEQQHKLLLGADAANCFMLQSLERLCPAGCADGFYLRPCPVQISGLLFVAPCWRCYPRPAKVFDLLRIH